MLVSKQVADFFTFVRALLAPGLVWLVFDKGEEALPIAIWTMIVSWTSDCLDGPLARRSKVQYHTWIGDHDLEIDMLVSIGLTICMLISGLISLPVALIYLLVWIVIFWRLGSYRSPGMLFQAPIYGWFFSDRNALGSSSWELDDWLDPSGVDHHMASIS